MTKKEYSLEIGGKVISAIFSDLADQTSGSVMVKCGQTVVIANATMGGLKDSDFFPLTVDFEERFYAAGKILGGQFIRREGRPTEEAILTSRIIDRTIRPLFAQHIRNDIQVVVTCLAIDEENDPDTLAIIAASLAIAASNIPWNGPVGAVRVGKKTAGDNLVVNPIYKDREGAALDAVICGRAGKVCMIETEAKEVDEKTMSEAFALALSEIAKLEKFQKDIAKEIGKTKTEIPAPELSAEVKSLFEKEIAPKLDATIFAGAGSQKIGELEKEWIKMVEEKFPEQKISGIASVYFNDTVDEIVHNEAVKNDRRADGRKMNQLRELSAEAGGISSMIHGTGIFYRGGTHVLSALTLGGPGDSQLLDGPEIRGKKYFMHHYNFPPYSSGETGRLGTNRRSIGHGALAEKSLRGILPEREQFPYTIRLVSESMASNGSTSMASVCASTVALMDGGVPIKRPAAGIAMGLMILPDGKYKVLTDIQGPEDHHGDMDFKVAGTREGITGIQLDIKVDGVDAKILSEALAAAKEARHQILDVIEKAISAPRANLAPSAPKIEKTKVEIEKIGAVIGPGGKVIQQLCRDYDVQIDIEQADGSVFITGKDLEKVKAARAVIEGIVKEYKAGEKFTGKVTRLMEFGAFVEIGPNAEGMVHISEVAPFRINRISDVIKEGEEVNVIIKEIDEKGRINLSIKDVDPNFASRKGVQPGAAPMDRPFNRAPRRDFGGHGGERRDRR
ncbi:MAG: polyribonucleotide nucleotidyltransferase [Candidatus Paceibacterota bacterium]|jgi:polyribonucleotide nucleotidyltransferase